MDFDTIKNKFPTFIIHVPELTPERSDYCLLNVQNAGYKNINLFKGVNGSNADEVNDALKLFNNPKFDYCCSKGNIGCNLSMLKVFLHIYENNIQYATIFEDDVLFHTEWDKLATQYYKHTPKDFDIIYMGNQIEECMYENNVPRINRKSCFCMHATIVSLKGVKKMLHLILNWNYTLESSTLMMGRPLTGITNCDIILKYYQDSILKNKISPNLFIWYCWNGTHYQCINNQLPLTNDRSCRNTGIVFQNCDFSTTGKII